MLIQLTIEDLIKFKLELSGYYLKAINAFEEDLVPYIENHELDKFQRHFADARTNFRNATSNPPSLIKI